MNPAPWSWAGNVDHDASRALPRLWATLMSARVLVALAMLGLHLVVHPSDRPIPPWVLGLCVAYLALTVLARMVATAQAPGQPWEVHWRYAVGIDIVFFVGLQWARATEVNYTPLLVLPVLLSAIMGSRVLALGTAALITLLLLGHSTWVAGATDWASTTQVVQAGLTGAGLLILAWLTSQISVRLRREESAARRNQEEARMQSLVSHLVLETLPDGVLVVDAAGRVRAANPAARAMLAPDPATLPEQFDLQTHTAWQPLRELARQTFAGGAPVAGTPIALHPAEHGGPHLLARTQHTRGSDDGESLCVLFLQDLHEIEARVRTERLAAMGRMSAAVAHEIRNPLTAISQANALLAEELDAPAQQRLTAMVQQNAQRLERIVADILDATGPGAGSGADALAPLTLDDAVRRFGEEWSAQHGAGSRLRLVLRAPQARVRFDAEHLRRVLVNLLDNAARHAGPDTAAIQVLTEAAPNGGATLSVWSDGAPLPASVRRHLFEPFSSTRSRSSGLGLFICRELCERHGAALSYKRIARLQGGQTVEGNQFSMGLRAAEPADVSAAYAALVAS